MTSLQVLVVFLCAQETFGQLVSRNNVLSISVWPESAPVCLFG